MKKNIKKCRDAGYQGLIQAVKITTENESWLLNSDNSLFDELKYYGYKDYHLTTVHNYIDQEEGLDITELEFSRSNESQGIIFKAEKNSIRNKLPYYQVVREFIGNSELFSCGISIIIENDKGEFVIGRRSDNGKWAFPAGSKELGESIRNTVHAEVMEEFGIEIEKLKLIGLLSGDELKVTYPNGHQMLYLGFVFYGRYKQGELLVNDHENTEVDWVSMDRLIELDTKTINKRLELLNSFKGHVLY